MIGTCFHMYASALKSEMTRGLCRLFRRYWMGFIILAGYGGILKTAGACGWAGPVVWWRGLLPRTCVWGPEEHLVLKRYAGYPTHGVGPDRHPVSKRWKPYPDRRCTIASLFAGACDRVRLATPHHGDGALRDILCPRGAPNRRRENNVPW